MATGRWGGWVLIWIPRTRYGQSGGGARAFVLAAARHVRSVLTELARARAPCQVEARATRSKVKDYAQRVREQNQRELAAKAQQAISRGRPAPGAKTAVAKAERKRIPTAREKAMEYAKTQVPGLLHCGDSTFPGIGLPSAAASGMNAANTLVSPFEQLRLMGELDDRGQLVP